MITDRLISTINELHDAISVVNLNSEINLPQIAVVGSQSSGKTSVLESLVGRDFLPRGSGIVTRCPLVLKLQQTAPGTAEYGEFGHKPTQRIEDFEQIRLEIERRTGELAGGMTVSSTPISLTVFSPKVLNLTLVDLPGIVATAIGDQPAAIVAQIEKMVTDFIRPANTIILAVTPANADLANSVAIRTARKVDPDFDRTIGVLTKLDLMDRGTDAVDILEGRLVPMKRGWIAVVNRSQLDIQNRITMEESRAKEAKFFFEHEKYARIADRQGTAYLAQTMSAVLLHHIQQCMPDLARRIDELVKKTRLKQEQLGMLDEPADKSSQLVMLLTKFVQSLSQVINGDGSSTDQPTVAGDAQLVGGARISSIFFDNFAPFVRSLRAGDHLTDEKLRRTTRNVSGLQASLYPSDKAFYVLAKEQVKRLDSPSQQCVTFVHAELQRLIATTAQKLLDPRYPVLRERVMAVANEALDALRKTCCLHLRTIVECEEDFINVKHPELPRVIGEITTALGGPSAAPASTFGGAPAPVAAAGGAMPPTGAAMTARGPASPQAAAVAPAPVVTPTPVARTTFEVPHVMTLTGQLTDREKQEFQSLRINTEAYFSIVKETICDQVPKHVVHMICTKLVQDLQPRLMGHLYKQELINDLLAESPDVAKQRKATSKMMECLLKAQAALGKVRDMPAPQ